MKIIIKDKARFAILLVLLAEIALFIAGILIGWIEPNPQRFVAIFLVAVVSVATAISVIGVERKTPEEPQSLDTLDGAINYCIAMAKMTHFSINKPEDKKYADELEQNYRQIAKYLIELKQCREHRKKISLYLTKDREEKTNDKLQRQMDDKS